MEMRELSPVEVFSFFDEICQVPRPSKKEERIIAYLRDFGKKHQLETFVDEAGNVLIKKNATPGMEGHKTVVLQAHVDMVCEKNKDVEHNFETDPIETYIDGEWLRARGTTLGADNGIGVAAALAVLASKTIEHGPLECLFTVDEETGLTGAFALQSGFMNGDVLLNLDSEDEGEIFIGCAGGCRTNAIFTYQQVDVPEGYFYFSVEVNGLTGGHSGDDINKGFANANKVLNRFLYQVASKYDFYLCEIAGGNLHNAIPREARAVFAVPSKYKEDVRIDLNVFAADIEAEYSVTEPNVHFLLQSTDPVAKAIDRDTTKCLLRAVHAVANGVFMMSQDMPGLVETSSNLASIKMIGGNQIVIGSSQRSSTLSSRKDMAETVQAAFELAGASVDVGDGYPGWKPNPQSPLLSVAIESYKRLYGLVPKVKAIHAGLECGLFLEKYPALDMISFGPTLRGVHSPDERMHIPSVARWWSHLIDMLKHI